MAFAKQVAALGQLLHQLFECNRLPLAAVARADALERRQHPERRIHLAQHRIAATAGGRAPGETFFVLPRQCDEAVADRRLHRQVRVGRQRAVRVAGHAQHLAAGLVDTHTHAALGGATEAGGIAHLLAGIGLEAAAGRVDAELRLERIAVQAVVGGVLSQCVFGHAHAGGGKAGGKGGEAAANGGLAKEIAAIGHDALRAVRSRPVVPAHGE